MEQNTDHYRFMPHSPGEQPSEEELQQKETIDEEAVIEEETVVGFFPSEDEEEPDFDDDAPARQSKSYAGDTDSGVFKGPLLGAIYHLLSPLFVPTIATMFLFFFSILHVAAPAAVLPYSLTVFGATCVIPFIALIILQRVGAITSFQLSDSNERIIPFVIEFLALGAMAIFFVVKGASPWIWTVFCGGAAIALANMVINFRMRISNHCSAMAGLLATLVVIQLYGAPQVPLFWWMVGVIFFGGLIGTLAMVRGQHTLWEVLAGYATGFLGVILFSLIH